MPTRITRGARTLICGSTFVILTAALTAAPAFALDVDGQVPAPAAAPVNTAAAERSHTRPAALVPLYVSFAGLNALDIDSTYRALGRNGEEANPIAASLVHSPAALIALKAGTAAAAIAATERLRRHRPRTAMVLMIGLNSAMATIVAHNYAVAAGGR